MLSATVAGTPARLGHRVDIPVSLLSAEGGGEFHFLVQGTDRAGTVLDSELERSLADRLLSRVARNDSVVTQGESFQLFFEDARLHAHRCSHDEVVGATVTASDRSIDLELSGSNLTPKALVLAHRPDLLDPIEATLEDVDGGRASATIDIDRLCHGIVSEHAWHFSWITDPDDPLPKPITLVEPAQTVAAGFGSRLHIVNTARSQLTVLVMPRIDRQAAERARSVLRTGRIPGVRQIKGHAK